MHLYYPGDDLFTPFERRRGLPIGNLTSQLFANVHLDGLDHFVKEVLRAPGYLRYVDDFALGSPLPGDCRQARKRPLDRRGRIPGQQGALRNATTRPCPEHRREPLPFPRPARAIPRCGSVPSRGRNGARQVP